MTASRISAPGHASLRRLIWLRWIAIGGQIAALFASRDLLGLPVPATEAAAVIVLQVAFNLLSHMQFAHAQRRDRMIGVFELTLQLLIDVAGLSAIVYLSGGVMNPMVTLYLPLIAIAAAILPMAATAVVASMAVAAYTTMLRAPPQVHIHDSDQAFQVHLIGMWFTFVFAAALIAWFVARMTSALRERDAELATAREAALRDERVVALGNLAAGAAHELGTPLATMAVLSGELLAHPTLPADLREDVELLASQVAHCRGLITRLAERAGGSRAEAAQEQQLRLWLSTLVGRWLAQRPRVTAHTDVHVGDDLRIVADATLEQALQNLFNNAADASPEAVSVAARRDADMLQVEVADRGAGLPPQVAAARGRETLSMRADGCGIGLMLAYSAIERVGGTLTFSARADGGTLATVRLPLSGLRADG